MTSKKQKVVKPVVAALPAAASEWLDQIVTGPMTAESVEEVMRKLSSRAPSIRCAGARDETIQLSTTVQVRFRSRVRNKKGRPFWSRPNPRPIVVRMFEPLPK